MSGWKPVTAHTRARYDGTFIKCPECGEEKVVFHFAWVALVCSGCRVEVEKTEWKVTA